MRVRRQVALFTVAAVLAELFAAPPTAHAATVRNVPGDYATITAALAASSSGDTVVVAPGTYFDGLFTVPTGVTVESSGGADVTIVNGVGKAPIATIDAGGIVRGLTLTEGGGNVFGGAAVVAGLLEDSRLIDNSACFGPSAVLLDGGTVQNSYFEGNASTCFSPPVVSGEGSILGNEFADNGHSPPIRMNDDSPIVEGNYFHDPGVVMQVYNQGNPIIRNNLVVATGAEISGLIELNHGTTESGGPTIVNNTFILASGNGPLVTTAGDDEFMTFSNNILVGQSGSTLLRCTNDNDTVLPVLQSNDLWTPSGAGLAGACAGVVGTSGNVSVDPKFVSSGTGDYHLRAYSSLIDGGVNAVAPATDFDGDSRPLDGNENGAAVVDIGFDETTLALGISPEALDLGDVPLGAATSDLITATNLGSSSISIDEVSLAGADAGDFEIVDETCTGGTLPVGDSCSIEVELAPSAYDVRSAELTVAGPGATGSLTIPLEGRGVNPFNVTPSFFEYPHAIVGLAIAGRITIENSGASVTMNDVGVSGLHAGDVTIGAETCTASPLTLGESCAIPFTFRALATGERFATIDVAASAPVGDFQVPIIAFATYLPSNLTWGSTSNAGPAYTWNGGGALARTVQSETQRLHLAYATNRIGVKWATNSGPKVGVYYVRSTSGTSWDTPFRLNPSSQHATVLGLAAAGKKVYTIWVSQTKWTNYNPTAPRQLFVRVNTRHGKASEWRSAKSLSSATGRVDYPVIAATGSDAHIAYTNAVNGNVYVHSSRDGGSTWARTTVGGTTIAFSDGRTAFPTIAASGSTVVACWLSDVFGTVKCRVSTNRGVSWGTTSTVGSQATGAISAAVRGTRMGVVWTTPASELVLAQRTGGAWTAPHVVPTQQTANGLYGPQLSLQDPNRIGVSWAEEYGNETKLRWTESANGGVVWQEANELSAPVSSRMRNDWHSVIWPSAGTRYVVWNGWTEGTSNYRLFFRRGIGTPVIPVSASLASTPWVATERPVTVLDPGSGDPSAQQP